MNKDMVATVKAYIDAHHDEMLQKYEEFINLPDFWRDADHVAAVGAWIQREFSVAGVDCQLLDTTEKAGKIVLGTLGADRPGKPILFTGHMDTSLESSLYPDKPFHIEDGKAYGPGVLDMKGGILISLYCIKALNAAGFNERPLKILFVPDEEGQHEFSQVPDVIMANGGGCLFAFNLETGLVNNALCVGRKGRIGIDVFVEGVEAHAGNDFTSGVNAIEEMAHKILDFQALTKMDAGTTVNTGVVHGGTIANAVAGKCMVSLDIRFTTLTERDRIQGEIEKICAKTYVKGTTTTWKLVTELGAYETQDDVMKFFDYMSTIADRYQMMPTSAQKLGGSSDAGFIQRMGTPILCSCGVRGQWNHTLREYAIVDSLFERAYWLAAACVDASEFKL